MNERIRELVNNAISDVDYIRNDDDLDRELAKMYIPDCFAEKFAELIVAECAESASYYGNSVRQHVLKHFGVEE